MAAERIDNVPPHDKGANFAFEFLDVEENTVPTSVVDEINRRIANGAKSHFEFGSYQELKEQDKVSTNIVKVKFGDQSKPFKEVVYVVDTIGGAYAGCGEIWKSIEGKTIPFVGAVETSDENKRTGLAERRYHVMNAVARREFDSPLYSGALNEQSESLWKKLVGQGFAEQVREYDLHESSLGAFRFKLE